MGLSRSFSSNARHLSSSVTMRDWRQALLQRAAYLVERNAKRETPVQTGTLRRSITTAVGTRRALIGTNLHYAVYVHEGTKHRRPNPYLERGLQLSRDSLVSLFREQGLRLLTGGG